MTLEIIWLLKLQLYAERNYTKKTSVWIARCEWGKVLLKNWGSSLVIFRNRWPSCIHSFIASFLSRWQQHQHVSLVFLWNHRNQMGIFVFYFFFWLYKIVQAGSSIKIFSFCTSVSLHSSWFSFFIDERNILKENCSGKMHKYTAKSMWYLKTNAAEFRENICCWLENEKGHLLYWPQWTTLQLLLTLFTKLSLLAVFCCVNPLRLLYFKFFYCDKHNKQGHFPAGLTENLSTL